MAILLADDSAVVRRALNGALAALPGVAVVDEASNGREVLEKVNKNRYDLVLLDFSMLDMNGLRVLRQLHKEKTPPRVVVFSLHSQMEYVVACMEAGASGYVCKTSGFDDLTCAIREVLAGRRYLSPDLGGKVHPALRARSERVGSDPANSSEPSGI